MIHLAVFAARDNTLASAAANMPQSLMANFRPPTFSPSGASRAELFRPVLRNCGVEMIPPSDYSQVSMSPYTAIVRMRTISEKFCIDRARRDGRFKREREAWAAGWLALAFSKLKDDVWWVEVEAVDATPDTKLRQIDETVNGNVINTPAISRTWTGK
jgi:hypothetical protein